MKKIAIRGRPPVKKIALRRETIAQLTHHQLATAGGGNVEGSNENSLQISCRADLCPPLP